ncbi:hypothetical protein BV22DRAFT_1027237, partial [Leucogyrophana mollusca]
FRCIYLTYQSQEDFTEGRDILRCSDSFHGEPRYDCVLINTEDGDLSPSRLYSLFRCSLNNGSCDVALVRRFKKSTWRAKTKWSGVRVYQEELAYQFVMVKYFVRGVHMITAFDGKAGCYYLNDLLDADIFLRAGN